MWENEILYWFLQRLGEKKSKFYGYLAHISVSIHKKIKENQAMCTCRFTRVP